MKHILGKITGIILLTIIFFCIYKIYIPRISAFGCFDDCFNYGAGFFITRGKILYKDIFFNHQPAMAYLSALIQQFTHPINIYELLLKHRTAILMWDFIWAVLLFLNFGTPFILTTILYESTKFYIFGDRFLAEGMIVYPFIYLFRLLIAAFDKPRIQKHLYIIGFIAAVFIFSAREPYIIALGILLFFITMFARKQRITWIWISSIGICCMCILLMFPFSEYMHQMIYVNSHTVLSDSLRQGNVLGSGLLQAFLYPLFIFISGPMTFFHQILICIDLIFILSFFILSFKRKYFILLLSLFLILGFTNLRTVPAGQMYYASFHLLPWYGIFISSSILLSLKIFYFHKKTSILLITIYSAGILYSLLSKQAFFYENIDRQTELITNYGEEIKIGNAIQQLSNKEDSIFLDGWAELIYWQADRISPYSYSWYTSVMPLLPEYNQEKIKMFKNNLPDFYYGSCPKETNISRIMPEFAQQSYIQLNSLGKPSCLWVKKSKLPKITDYQWQKAKDFLVDRPE